jgi:hypothetical protein
MLEIFQLTCGSYPKVCCMKESTVASDGRLTAGAGLSADLVAVEVCAARLHASRETKIRVNELRIFPFCSLVRLEIFKTLSHFALRRDRKTAAIAECLGRNLDARRRLLSLVLGAVDHSYDAPHSLDVEAAVGCDSLD